MKIWNVRKKMKNLKSPCPYGIPEVFFKRCWEQVGQDVTQTIKHCFSYGSLPPGLKHTHIIVILKIRNNVISTVASKTNLQVMIKEALYTLLVQHEY
ncbi:hypothetical protein C5167_042069 [Papaver somniferum]|nr:hypothetical protein C5167_042069 [Papaver somniferum]